MKNKQCSNINRNRTDHSLRSSLHVILIFILLHLIPGSADVYGENAKYIILMISDGWGAKHIEATNTYTGTVPLYQSDPNWTRHWMSTFPDGDSYNTAQAWSDFNYAMTSYGDSSACGTALYTGFKTANGRITVSADGSTALSSIGERAKVFGKAVGAVSTVPVSHATPGAWVAHNDDRGNTFAIADEGLFGDPNTTGTIATDVKYGGGHGPTIPPVDVLIGEGGSDYVSSQILAKLRNEHGQPGKHILVERQAGADGGDALMAKANDPATYKLAGLFDHVYHNANDSGYNAENPTLSESTLAAIKVLSRNPNGFVLMIEGGAVDWAAHANNMDQMIGEQKDYDNAVQTVIDWIEDPANDSNWENTLLIVTGDHECGYLTRASGVFPNQSLGAVNSTTLAKEKIVSGTGGRRASWEDTDGDSIIDAGETVYWQWNSGGHSNSLIPLYARGAGSELLADYATKGPDTHRGYYLDNTDVFLVMDSAISAQTCTETGSVSIAPGQTLSGNSIDLTSIVQTGNAINVNYKVTETGGCPAQTNASIITKGDTWKYNGANNGNIGTTWKDDGYNDSGWSTGSGIFGYGETYINTLIGAPGQMSAYFRKTFTICNAGTVTSLKFHATYDDGMAVYINGRQVIAHGVTGNPPVWNGGAVGHESSQVYQVFDLDPYMDMLVNGTNVIAVGIYNVDSISSDLVFDGELVINSNAGGSILFTGSHAQAQSINTTGWSNGLKGIAVTADDAVCLTPLPSAHGTFTFESGPPCIETGSVSITQGQALSGNPVDLTSIVQTGNAINVNYKVTETGGCPAQTNASIITKGDTWKYKGANNGNIGTTWKDAGYDDSGWSTSSGIFGYGETYINTLIGAQGQMSMYFRKTFTICDANAVTSLTFNATYDDGMAVYINGTRVIAQGITGNPPVWNAGAAGHESDQLYQTFNLDAYTGILASGSNVIAVGIYNVDSTSSDLVFDGELNINSNMGDSTLFTGDAAQAHSVNTTGWPDGGKNLEVMADDAVCLTPLLSAHGTFTFDTCIETGSVSITPGQTLSGNPVNLTSIITSNNAANINYTVTEPGSCPAQTNASIITKRDTWKYNGTNNVNIGTIWKDIAYDDSEWSTGSGIFGYGEAYINTLVGAPGQMSAYFRKTFTICDANAVTSLKLNATYDDGITVYINGTQVLIAGASGNPPAWNAGQVPGAVTSHESNNPSAPAIPVYTEFDLIPYIGQLVSGVNVIAVGIYNTDSTSSDLVFDGELNINSNTGDSILFTGNASQAHSVNTTGWPAGGKNLEVMADDAVCLTPLPSAKSSFYYNVRSSTAGITVKPTSKLVTTETGRTATFTVVLNKKPRARVHIALHSSDPTEGRVSPTVLTFTTTNWNKAQQVMVTGVDDFIADGDQSYTIVTHAAVSTDSAYYGRNAADVSVTNVNDDIPGVKVGPISGLTTTEWGSTASFTVVLKSQPETDVAIDLISSDAEEGTVSPANLIFTSANWNMQQTVTVTGADDLVADGSQTYMVMTQPAVSSDNNYNGLNAPDVLMTNSDNETPGVTVNPSSGLTTTEAGGTAAFTVVLNKKPRARVNIALHSSDTTEGRISPTVLTFTTTNWNKAQQVMVTGVDDFIADGDQSYTIVTHAAVSTDSAYSGMNAVDVSVMNSDNERP